MRSRVRYIIAAFAIYTVLWLIASNYYLIRFHKSGLNEAVSEPFFWLLMVLLIATAVLSIWRFNSLKIKEDKLDRKSREQQAEHDLIFTQSAVGLLKANFQGIIVECNQYLASMLGYKVEELTGMNFINVTHPQDVAKDLKVRRELNAVSGTEFNYNKRWTHKNGSVVWSNVNGTIQRFDDGRIDFFIAAITNIQPLVEANEALELEKSQTEAMINNSTDIMWSLNTELKFIKFNKTFEKILLALTGRQAREGDASNFLLDNADLQKDSKETVNKWGKNYMRALSGERFRVFDKTVLGEKEVFFDIIVSPMKDEEGKIFGVSCVGRSITERIELFNALEQSEAKYKDIFENSPVPLMLCDPESGYLSQANKLARERYGFLEDQIHGVKIAAVVDESDRALFNEVFQKVTDPSLYETTQNVTVKQHFGNVRNQETQMILHRAPEAGNDSILIYNMDISARKKMEEDILQAVLETEDKERSRIARDLHDGLTQNLTVSSLHFKGIQDDIEEALPEKIQEKYVTALRYLNESITESRNLSHHIMPKAIMDYGLVLSLEQLLGDLEDAVTIDFQLIENLKGERLPTGIELHLYRICQEAIQNIIKYSKADKAVVQLLKHAKDLTLSIEDDGVGIDQSKKEERKGHGFKTMESRALSLAGRFSFESSPGKGTIIQIQIPLHEQKEVQGITG